MIIEVILKDKPEPYVVEVAYFEDGCQRQGDKSLPFTGNLYLYANRPWPMTWWASKGRYLYGPSTKEYEKEDAADTDKKEAELRAAGTFIERDGEYLRYWGERTSLAMVIPAGEWRGVYVRPEDPAPKQEVHKL